MKKLVTVTHQKLITELSNKEDITLVYPLQSFCVGYDLTFPITEIDDFVLVNRILTDGELDTLRIILKESHIKGILFDDLGILEIIADLKIEKILILDHLLLNHLSINYYLDYVDSVVVSSDLRKEEITEIVKNAKKKVCLLVFDLKRLMYSRRLLLSNYAKYYNLDLLKEREATILDKPFIIKENEYGTIFYMGKYYNALELLKLDNVLYFWYNLVNIPSDKALKIILENKVEVDNNQMFLKDKMYFKVRGNNND